MQSGFGSADSRLCDYLLCLRRCRACFGRFDCGCGRLQLRVRGVDIRCRHGLEVMLVESVHARGIALCLLELRRCLSPAGLARGLFGLRLSDGGTCLRQLGSRFFQREIEVVRIERRQRLILFYDLVSFTRTSCTVPATRALIS